MKVDRRSKTANLSLVYIYENYNKPSQEQMSLTITNYFIKNMQKYQRIHRDQVDEVGVMNAKATFKKESSRRRKS
jgi:hypothetical protein